MTNLVSISKNALKYGFSICTHNLLRWLALTVVLAIPILNFVGIGILLKILRNEDPTFEDGSKSFVQGLLAFVIILIYSLIPLCVYFLTQSLNIAGIIITLILFVLFYSILLIPALVNYARKQRFLSAFRFPEIFANIRKMTWSGFILALLVFIIIDLLIALILFGLWQIQALGIIVSIVLMSPICLFIVKYWTDVFS